MKERSNESGKDNQLNRQDSEPENEREKEYKKHPSGMYPVNVPGVDSSPYPPGTVPPTTVGKPINHKWESNSNDSIRLQRLPDENNENKDEGFEYPVEEDIHKIHNSIVEESEETTAGKINPEMVDSALSQIKGEVFGQKPDTIDEKAAVLMHRIVSGHPYADGNKRTALNSAEMFYLINGYVLEYEDEMVDILRKLATDSIEIEEVEELLEEYRRPVRMDGNNRQGD